MKGWFPVNMLDYIEGKLVHKTPTTVVVDNNGLGYSLRISVSTSGQLPQEGQIVKLKTYLHVREDVLQLYGFAEENERELFLALISVSGVGPKLAQTILSGLSPERFAAAIQNNDQASLNTISGVGKKTAERLLVEMRDKIKSIAASATTDGSQLPPFAGSAYENEAMMALISLGYSRQKAENAIRKAQKDGPFTATEELVKKALQVI